jgi:hypothetical protein
MSEVVGTVLLSVFGTTCTFLNWYWDISKKREEERQKRTSELVWQLFPKSKGIIQLIEGKSSDFVPKEVRDPEDSAGSIAATDLILGPHRTEYTLKLVDYTGFIPIEYNADHWLIGGAPSNPFTKKLFSYDQNKLALHPPFAPINFYFDYNVPMGDNVKRYFMGVEHKAGNWMVRSKKDKNLKFKVEPDKKGFQKNDYLIISVLPNWLSGQSSRLRSFVIQGAHGVGTIAFRKVIEDEKVLEEILEARKGANFWQSLIEVTKIKHTLSKSQPMKSQSQPLEIEHIETVPLFY